MEVIGQLYSVTDVLLRIEPFGSKCMGLMWGREINFLHWMRFVRLLYNISSFQKFVRELQKCVKTKPEGFHLKQGTFCLGKCPDDGL